MVRHARKAGRKASQAIDRAGSVAGEAIGRAGAAAGDAAARVKPRLRGVIHQYAFWVAIGLALVLVWRASTAKGTAAMAIYGIGLVGLFGISALYHRPDWKPKARAWMRRLDHSMIYVFIAASVTPFALLVLDGGLAWAVLAIAWGGALLGVLLSVLWVSAPKWLTVGIYVALGWAGVICAPKIFDALGWWAIVGLVLSGLLYTAGGIIYATGRPDPAPRTFGYHEVFHSLVTGAAGAHYLVVAVLVLPLAA